MRRARIVLLVAWPAFVAALNLAACTFKIDPVVEVNDASVQVGPIYVCFDAGPG